MIPSYQTKYQDVFYYPESSLIDFVWKPETNHMTTAEYKAEMLEALEIYMKHLTEKQIVDTRNFFFSIGVDLQKWTDENFLRKHTQKSNLKKVAFIVSTEIFSQVSLEQTMEENYGQLFNIQYFDDKDSALAWLH